MENSNTILPALTPGKTYRLHSSDGHDYDVDIDNYNPYREPGMEYYAHLYNEAGDCLSGPDGIFFGTGMELCYKLMEGGEVKEEDKFTNNNNRDRKVLSIKSVIQFGSSIPDDGIFCKHFENGTTVVVNRAGKSTILTVNNNFEVPNDACVYVSPKNFMNIGCDFSGDVVCITRYEERNE